MSRNKTIVRRDFILPAQPVEMLRFLLESAIQQARQNKSIVLEIPAPTEIANVIVNRTRPIEITTITAEEIENV